MTSPAGRLNFFISVIYMGQALNGIGDNVIGEGGEACSWSAD